MKTKQLQYLLSLTAGLAVLLSTGCATAPPPPKYAIYDASQGAAKKGCVDFFTQHPASTLKYYPTAIYRYDDQGKAQLIGSVGGEVPERFRCVLPAGSHKFKHGNFPKFKELTVTVPNNMVVPVEVTTKASPAAFVLFGLGGLVSERCEAIVGTPQPWYPSDHEWEPWKLRN